MTRSLDEGGLSKGARVGRDLVAARQAFLVADRECREAEAAAVAAKRRRDKMVSRLSRAERAFDEVFRDV